MESFWGTLKNESRAAIVLITGMKPILKYIREYIEIFYNRQRRPTLV